MKFPERFAALPEYAFPRLRALLDHHEAGGEPVSMTIGEPTHPFPDWVAEVLASHLAGFNRYPPNEGTPELRTAVAGWVKRRYGAVLDPATQICNVNGSREALFNACLAVSPERKAGQRPFVLVPNPFYQVYAVAAVASEADPVYVPATAATGFLPDYAALPAETLDRVTVAYLCSPANPQGAVASLDYWLELLALAEKHDFKIFADECYSEIWRTAPPPGALEALVRSGADPERVVVFNSLSKRSNLPGARSGFVAGGPETMARIKQLRSYNGAPVPLPLQAVSTRAWSDETHVIANQALYAEKYALADEVFAGAQGYQPPEGGFFLWLPVEDGEAAALKLWTQTGVRVLPGAYLSRDTDSGNPGKGYIRVALVAPKDELKRGLIRLRDCLYG
ncbi:aspartate aminotransferase [Haematobacter massiliensis]|uniref:Aspartate aminotransferase n=1 Tax=Haematobacter massiliensis TaxID=195105 RepID=A0A086XZD2_9RHOB|nr:aminotransferase class I/II-fold pyridoxal phosphate-dependent enzyme [Haematobacter massiliensis]KFI27382.1 aspartate aminotransferase [Haematobacter massiliensis]OWJ70800.1 aspartate aminotransferase [Haematobacter massiliensis]OWJ84876.1 aspartate aminotransferase [Haematobacter massiliensis]QBJ23829.1 aminotransferase class I/II-fold pyridoxal phosphate-dependent enzyme [Haematobacter massiliensis]